MKKRAAIIGSGNIGTDLLIKLQERSGVLEAALMVGIDEASDGLARARARGVATSARGLDGLLADDPSSLDGIDVVFDATSAGAHLVHAPLLAAQGKRVVDLTPAAIGPYVVPVANISEHLDAPNVNLVTCGGQATIPIVWAASRVAKVEYAEIVASIASRSAGPGTRANIDEFTRTTARGLEVVGGAARGKAIIILNPASPPLIMRDTVYLLVDGDADRAALRASIEQIVAEVSSYVPGYRLVQPPVFEQGAWVPRADGSRAEGLKVAVLLEVEGAGDYLPNYAGNLDIMTSAAQRVGELMVMR
jgi:acetaldehyde dehydrogenase